MKKMFKFLAVTALAFPLFVGFSSINVNPSRANAALKSSHGTTYTIIKSNFYKKAKAVKVTKKTTYYKGYLYADVPMVTFHKLGTIKPGKSYKATQVITTNRANKTSSFTNIKGYGWVLTSKVK